MKEHRSAVDWRGICAAIVVVELLLSGVEIVAKVLLKSKEVKPLVDLALSEIVHDDLARRRRRNITLRCHGSRRGARRGFTGKWSLAPPRVIWS
jgi:hypothetical protein